MIFHEAMHQWDGPVFDALNVQAKALNLAVPLDIPHAMISYEERGASPRRACAPSLRRVARHLAFQLSGARQPAQRLKGPLEETWRPYLNGRGTRDEALAALLGRVGIAAAAK